MALLLGPLMLPVRFASTINIDKRQEGHEGNTSTRRCAKRERWQYAWCEEEETIASQAVCIIHLSLQPCSTAIPKEPTVVQSAMIMLILQQQSVKKSRN